MTEEQKDWSGPDTGDLPASEELFCNVSPEELSEQDLFVGDVDFYRSLQESQAGKSYQLRPIASAGRTISRFPTLLRKFSPSQKVLVAAIIATSLVLLYTLSRSPQQTVADDRAGIQSPDLQQQPQQTDTTTPTPGQRQLSQAEPKPNQAQSEPPVQTRSSLPATQPVSLKVAKQLYQRGNYELAYAVYDQLRQDLPKEATLQKDLLLLRMALCAQNTGREGYALELLEELTHSSSPIVRVMASYYLCRYQLRTGQYLNARTNAYRMTALLDAAGFKQPRVDQLHQYAEFLAAEALSRYLFSLWEQRGEIPEKLWEKPNNFDPFEQIPEQQLISLAGAGTELLAAGTLEPKIEQLGSAQQAKRWRVVCKGMPLEELLAKLADIEGLNITWQLGTGAIENSGQIARSKPVYAYLSQATTQQLVTIAAGAAGLIARLEQQQILISSPGEYTNLAKHTESITRYVIGLWQRFLLAYPDNAYAAHAHFMLALLWSRQDELAEAIAEYKIVANRHPDSELAPYALYNCSRLRTTLRDEAGAREDLLQLVELYRQCPIYSPACLRLAESYRKAALYQQAAKLYRRIFNFSSSRNLQAQAALGASKCYYQRQQYEAAAEWLGRYLQMKRNSRHGPDGSAYLLLGKIFLGQNRAAEACEALRRALANQLDNDEYLEALAALVKVAIKRQEYIIALEALENVPLWRLSPEESMEVFILESKVLQQMGLLDKATALLRDKAKHVLDPLLRARIDFELSQCYIAAGNYLQAQQKLSQLLTTLEPGALSRQVTLSLARVWLELDRPEQAISLCSSVLDQNVPQDIQRQARRLLARAYSQRNDYNRATLALLGHDQRNK